MDLDAMAKRAVKQAFKSVGTLAEMVTFTEKSSKNFDFNSGKVNTTKPTTKSIRGLLVLQSRAQNASKLTGRENPSTVVKTMIFQSVDIDDPDIYDTITTSDGKKWTMIPPYENDGMTIKVTMSREA